MHKCAFLLCLSKTVCFMCVYVCGTRHCWSVDANDSALEIT